MPDKIEILRVLVGSRAHGLETPDSDYDFRGVYVTPTRQILSLGHKYKGTAWMEGETDNTSYEIGHFLHLASKANPSILEVLVADQVLHDSAVAVEMREILPYLYNPQDAYNAFTGYGYNQRKKLLDGNKDERTWKYAVAWIRTLINLNDLLSTGSFSLKVKSESERQFLRELRAGDYTVGDVVNEADSLIAEADKSLVHALRNNKQDLDKVNDFLVRVRKEYW